MLKHIFLIFHRVQLRILFGIKLVQWQALSHILKLELKDSFKLHTFQNLHLAILLF